MSKNIKSQFHNAINQNFQEGTDKHSYKEQNGTEMSDRVFSYTSKFNLLDTARNFSNYLKENHNDIRLIRDIKPEHIQEFLNTKAESCTQNTIDTYSQNIFKLEVLAEKTYGIDLSWREECVKPIAIKDSSENRGVESVMSREDLNIIVSYATENRSQSGDAVRLQEHLGIRVEEVVAIKLDNIKLDSDTPYILIDNCKGGKDLERELSPGAVDVVRYIISQNYGTDTLFTIKGASVNEYLRDTQDKLGLERHSFHDIRRCIAQEKYDGYRESGVTIKEAADKTAIWLNHGKDREAMLKESYIVLR